MAKKNATAPAATAAGATSEGLGDPRPECIRCKTCQRVCAQVGPWKEALQHRGAYKHEGPPFGDQPPACIGCLACARSCPTGHLQFQEDVASRKIGGRRFDLQRCPQCGRAHVTQVQVAWLVKRTGLPRDHFLTCDRCKRAKTAGTFASLLG